MTPGLAIQIYCCVLICAMVGALFSLIPEKAKRNKWRKGSKLPGHFWQHLRRW